MDHSFDTCFDVRSALPLYVGGDLEAEELRAVEGHLETCPSCQEHQQRAQSARAVLTARRDEPTPDLWAGIRAQLATEGVFATAGPSAGPRGPRPLETAPALRPVPLIPIGVLSAAAAVVCAFLLAGFWNPGTSAGSGQGPGNLAGTGGAVIGTTPVVDKGPTAPTEGSLTEDRERSPKGFLRPLPDGAEFMYPHGREMHTEQGIVVPGMEPRSPR